MRRVWQHCFVRFIGNYTRRINFRENWRGHLWQERFHSFVMDESYLLATVRYVEHNPVRPGLCQKPEDWRWSSTRAHLYGSDDQIVTVQPMLDRINNWGLYLATSEPDTCLSMIRKNSRTGRPLGKEGFIDALEGLTGKVLKKGKPGPKPRNKL